MDNSKGTEEKKLLSHDLRGHNKIPMLGEHATMCTPT